LPPMKRLHRRQPRHQALKLSDAIEVEVTQSVLQLPARMSPLATHRLPRDRLRSCRGRRVERLPLCDRKAKLARLLARAPAGIAFNEHTDEDGAMVVRHACKLGPEGIASK
jgi:bifunctional non-homologous end joining protein LigD